MPRYYSPEEKQSIIEEFKRSGLSKAKFSRLKNIGESSLYKWSKEVGMLETYEENNFIPMQLAPEEKHIANSKNFYIKLHENITLEFPCGFNVDYFNELLQVLMK